jgi:hypothetical protein
MTLENDQTSTSEIVEQQSETEVITPVAGEADAPEVVETDEQKNERVKAEDAERAQRKEEKRQLSVQKRIDELTADKYAERKRADELAARLERMEAATAKPAAQPSGAPKREDFEDYADFVRADAKFEAVQAARELVESERRQQQETQTRSTQEQSRAAAEKQFLERRAAVEKEIPDYRDVIEDWEPKLPDSVVEMIVDLEQGPLISYHLAKNPELEAQFRNAPARMHGVLMGQLIATLKSPPKVTAAPTPGKPVGAKATSSSNGDYTGPPEGYYAWAKKNLR